MDTELSDAVKVSCSAESCSSPFSTCRHILLWIELHLWGQIYAFTIIFVIYKLGDCFPVNLAKRIIVELFKFFYKQIVQSSVNHFSLANFQVTD